MSPLLLTIMASACLSTAALAFVTLNKQHNIHTTLRQRECCAELWAFDALTCKDGTPCPLFDAKIGDSTPAITIEAEALIESDAPVVSQHHFVWPTIALFAAVAGVIICCYTPFHRRQCNANAAQASDEMGIEDDSDKGVSITGGVQHSDDESRVPSENDLGNTRSPAVAQAEARARAIAEEQAIAEAVEEAAAAAEAAAEAVAIAEAEAQIQAESNQEGSEAEAAAASRAGEPIIAASSISRLENGTHGDVEAEEPSDNAAAIVHQTSGNSSTTGTTGTGGALASESGVDVDQSGSATLSSNVNGATRAVAAIVANGFPVDTTATAAVTPMENGEIHPRD